MGDLGFCSLPLITHVLHMNGNTHAPPSPPIHMSPGLHLHRAPPHAPGHERSAAWTPWPPWDIVITGSNFFTNCELSAYPKINSACWACGTGAPAFRVMCTAACGIRYTGIPALPAALLLRRVSPSGPLYTPYPTRPVHRAPCDTQGRLVSSRLLACSALGSVLLQLCRPPPSIDHVRGKCATRSRTLYSYARPLIHRQTHKPLQGRMARPCSAVRRRSTPRCTTSTYIPFFFRYGNGKTLLTAAPAAGQRINWPIQREAVPLLDDQ